MTGERWAELKMLFHAADQFLRCIGLAELAQLLHRQVRRSWPIVLGGKIHLVR